MVEIDRRKAALIAELEISRGEIRRSLRTCEENLDVVSVLRKNVRSNLKFWLPGAALGGWVVSRLLSIQLGRPREPRGGRESAPGPAGRTGGWIGTLLRVAVDLLRPTLLSLGTEWLARKAAAFSASSGAAPSAPEARSGGAERHAHTRNGMF